MKGLAWKIALVTAVLAVGFLVILQAQRGMTQAMLQKSNAAQEIASTSPSAETPADAVAAASPSPPKEDPFGDAGSTRDAAAAALNGSNARDSKSGSEIKSDGDTKTVAPLSDAEIAGKDSSKTAEKTADGSGSKGNAPKGPAPKDTASDPFADNGDAKHQAPAIDSKAAATNGAEVKQASGSTEPAMPAAAGPTLPASDGPSLGDSAPSDLKTNDSKSSRSKPNDFNAPPTQSEPSAGLQIEPPRAQNHPDHKPADQKSSGGPQLPMPGPSLDLPAGSGSPELELKSASTTPSVPGPGDGTAPPSTPSQPADKPSAKSAAPDPAGAGPPYSPKPFPDEGPKEAPLPAPGLPAPNASNSSSTPLGPVLDLTPGNDASSSQAPTHSAPPNALPNVPETKSADATNAPPSGQRTASERHSEATPDFQGDGTVGDAAPLGPQRPQLNIEKIAPQNALLGQPLIYSILVRNVGQSAARDVVVEDRIPKGTKLSGTIPRAELTGKKLIWRLGTLGGGEQRKISIRVIPLEAGEIGSVATVNFVAEAAAETVVTAPRLEFKISAPSTARLGELVPFHFEVRNVGTGEARGVVIRDLIPRELSHSAGSDLEYEVGRLMPGKSKQLTLDLKAGKVGTAVNRAVVLAEGGLSTEAKATIEISGSKIGLTRSGPQRRYLGRQAVFTNTLVNESSFSVDGVVLVESIPAGMDFAGASHGGQYNDGSRTIAWRIDPMAPGETRVVKSRLVARALGNQTSTVRMTVPNGEPVEATSQTQVEGFAALGLEVSGVDGPVDLGEKITLHVNARNKGTVAVTNLVVSIEIPEQMEVISTRGPGKAVQEAGRLKFGPVGSLEGRTTAACEIVLAARKRGDSRVRVSIQADQVDKPLSREESILILSESTEPTATR